MCSPRPLAIFIFVLILISSPVAQGQSRHDGHFWEILSNELKVSYIQGVIDGSILGMQMVREGLPTNDPSRDKIVPGYRKTAQKLLVDVSPAQIAEGVDTVFKDYRNRSLLMTDAVYVTLKSISGMSPQDIETLLQAVRGAPK
jgi:hypothetical protein